LHTFGAKQATVEDIVFESPTNQIAAADADGGLRMLEWTSSPDFPRPGSPDDGKLDKPARGIHDGDVFFA